jgi:S1-C subfamily serine protease
VSVGGGHGLELVKVDPASFLAKLGLRSGDVLQKIEGTALDDVDHVPDLSSAADRAELTIGFSRNDIGLTVSRPIQ